MKKLLLALSLAALFPAVHAQTSAPVPSPAVESRPSTLATGGPQAAPVVQVTNGSPAVGEELFVNPINGKSLSVEQLQLELERAEMSTKLLSEKLKQANSTYDLNNLVLRKGVEAAQARTQIAKEASTLRDVEQQSAAKQLPAPQAAPTEPPPKSAKELARERAAAKAAADKAARAAAELAKKTPPATLLSVLSVGNKRSVVLDIKGNIATVSDGETSPVGPVRVIDGGTASVNGWTLKVHEQTIGRWVASDGAVASNTGTSGVSRIPAVPTIAPTTPPVLPPAIPVASSGTPKVPTVPGTALPVSLPSQGMAPPNPINFGR